jgi:lactate/malate dehydrogenase, NAD binding domain
MFVKGVCADVQKVRGYDPTPSALAECLSGSEIVLIPAGVPRKPGMTRDGEHYTPISTTATSNVNLRPLQDKRLNCPRFGQSGRGSCSGSQHPYHRQPGMSLTAH